MTLRDVTFFGLGAAAGAAAAIAIREATNGAEAVKADDDQPIIMSGGSPLDLHAGGRQFIHGSSGQELVHATPSGIPTSNRTVQSVDVIQPTHMPPPAIVNGQLEITVQYDADGGQASLTLISERGRGLRVEGSNVWNCLDPRDHAHISIPASGIRSVTMNGESCDTKHFRLKIHYVGHDS